MKIEFAIEEWKNSGFLTDIPQDKQKYAAKVLNFVVDNQTKGDNNLSISIIQNIIKQVVLTRNDIKRIIKDIAEKYNEYIEQFDNHCNNHCTSKFISKYSEEKIKELTNNV